MKLRSILLALAIALPAALLPPAAHTTPMTREMSLHAALESASMSLGVLAQFSEQNPYGAGDGSAWLGAAGLSWSGMLTETGYSLQLDGRIGGQQLSLQLTGSFTGADGADILFSLQGNGQLGSEPLFVDGTMQWHYDAAYDDYFDADFAQHVQVGANSRHGYPKGTERYLCLVEGDEAGDGRIVDAGGATPIAGAPVQLTAAASSGKKADAGTGIKKCWRRVDLAGLLDPGLTATASQGKKGGMLVSRTTLPPLAELQSVSPAAPAPIDNYFHPSNLGSFVQASGELDADDPFNRYRFTGRLDGDAFSGRTFDVPAPAPAVLLALALCAMPRRRRPAQTPSRA